MNEDRTILIVDDNDFDRMLLASALEEHGYNTVSAEDGAQALRIVQSVAVDLVLLDIVMPGMDGREVCRRLKVDPLTSSIPVILQSSLDDTQDVLESFAAGGVDYVTKPFRFEEVLARIETHLSLQSLQKQLKDANRELSQRLAELKARNEELDAFAHTVAHDLKNPLALVKGYAELLQREGRSMEPDDFDQSVAAVVDGATKMNSIIKALLLFARMQRNEIEVRPLESQPVVDEAMRRVRDMIEATEARVALPPRWPQARGYAPWLEEVWFNYLSNALKYGGEPPRLELGAAAEAGEIRFWVRDNGAGLTAEQRDRLFVPFERLGQSRVAGHGLGLCIVRRIVEKLGGRVGCDSAPEGGSTFWFTLPSAEGHPSIKA